MGSMLKHGSNMDADNCRIRGRFEHGLAVPHQKCYAVSPLVFAEEMDIGLVHEDAVAFVSRRLLQDPELHKAGYQIVGGGVSCAAARRRHPRVLPPKARAKTERAAYARAIVTRQLKSHPPGTPTETDAYQPNESTMEG